MFGLRDLEGSGSIQPSSAEHLSQASVGTHAEGAGNSSGSIYNASIHSDVREEDTTKCLAVF
ncbi:hypothetical protein MKY93_14770 [Sporosarcina sp. FSL W7-1283]|uniref:hypothetical protein n=1 Tax=Sporosarcina sp. FSL W7-1283 TaxID=2921560 RepID=UPI0003123630